MQQNFVLQALKTLVILAFTVALGLSFFKGQSVEEKVVHTYDKVNELVGQVAEQGRKADRAAAAAEATQQRLDAILELAARGEMKGGGTGEGPVEPQGKPSVIAGKTLYPRNPGWTVLCDATANADPKRDLPPDDQIDWDATLNDYTPGEPKGWNPYSTDRTVTVAALSYYTLDAMAERKTTNIVEWNAQLAERVEESPDHTRYIIYLRKGIRWHDPEPAMLAEHPWLAEPRFLTAKDVKFTVDIIRNPDAASPLAYLFDDLASVEVKDDHTLEVVWKRPNYYARAITLEIQPIPEHVWARDPNGDPYADTDVGPQFGKHWFGKSVCGTGPLRFVEYKRGEYVRCERNESYYGPRIPYKTYYYHIVRDDETRLARYWNKEMVAIIPSYEQYRKYVLQGEPSLQMYKYDDFQKPAPASWSYTYKLWRRPTYSGFGWNMRKPLFEDKRVRRALTMALNRAAVIESIFYGLGEQLAIGESVFSPYNHPGLKALPFDLEGAKRLFEEAGWKDTNGDGIRDKEIGGKVVDFEFEMLISTNAPEQTAIVQLYKEDLLKCGVRAKAAPAEAALWSKAIHDRTFDVFIIFWTAAIDNDPRQIWESKRADDPASSNYTGFKGAKADKIFDDLITTFDLDERKRLFREWYEIEYDEQPYTWIWSLVSPLFTNPDWRVPEPRLPPPALDRRLMFRWKRRP